MRIFIYNLTSPGIKTMLITLTILLFTSTSFSQILPNMGLNIDENATFKSIQKTMNDYWSSKNVKGGYVLENGVEKKVPNWKLYKRWEYYWEQRVNLSTGEFPATTAVDEYEKYLTSQNNTLNKVNYNENWTNLGTNSSTGGYAGIGRINCIAFHPTDPNIVWVGSPSGGIWKTENVNAATPTWTILNGDLTVLGVSAIVVDYTDPNILYIATGDRDGGSLRTLSGGQGADNASIGILKSTDGGATWNTTGLTYTTSQGVKVFDLIMDPSNSQILLASTSLGVSAPGNGAIYRTTNGGANWTESPGSFRAWRLAFKPGDPSIVYGTEAFGGEQYFQRSVDGGANWADFTFGSGTDASRTELAVTGADPNVVYLVTCKGNSSTNGIYKSTDSGVNFTKIFTPTTVNLLGYDYNGGDLNAGQGSYDLCIAANPTNADEVYVGGVNTWKTTDGGTTWNIATIWSGSANGIPAVPVVHADKHALVYQSGGVLFEGNDGGIYKVTNSGATYEDKSNGLVISQIYRLGVSQTNSNIVLTGLQDNGTKLFSGGFWTDPKGGDGMECIVDFNDPANMYATYVEGQISRSTDGGVSFPDDISANISGGKPAGAWVAPYIIDPNNSSTLFAGYDQVWKTIDRGDNWTSASQQLSASDFLRSLAIAPSNSNVLYTADPTHMWKTTDGGATNWSSITTLPALSNSITYIAVHATNPDIVWFTVGGFTAGQKVYQSIDGGATWTEIGTGLPNLPIMSIVQYKTAINRNVLFVSTDLGVYVKDENANGNAWVAFNNGLPNVVVSELEILYTGGGDKLRAATFGRGLWETNIDAALPVELVSFAYSVKNNSVMLNWSTATEVNNYGFDVERAVISNEVRNLSWEKIAFIEGNGNSSSTKNYEYEDKNINSGKYSYRLKQIDNDGQYSYSNIVEVDLGLPKEFVLSQNYPNPFNPSTVISYQLAANSQVTLKVYDILGNEVSTLVNQTQDAGKYDVKFDASNYSNGVYFYQIKADNFTSTKKMILMK